MPQIQLPDGTILEAPEGADIGRVVRGYRAHQQIASDPGQYDPNSEEFQKRFGPESTVGEAFSSGARRVGAGALNLMGKMKGATLFPMLARPVEEVEIVPAELRLRTRISRLFSRR